MSAFIPNDTAPLLIEITPEPGVQQVALTPAELAVRADEVMQQVMNAIYDVSRRVSDLYANLPDQFTQVELGFGVKISSEMGALIAKAGMESTFNVKLVWEKKT